MSNTQFGIDAAEVGKRGYEQYERWQTICLAPKTVNRDVEYEPECIDSRRCKECERNNVKWRIHPDYWNTAQYQTSQKSTSHDVKTYVIHT